MVEMDRVLVVAAHPDDEVLGCGATIRKLIESGAHVRIVIIGEGSSCRYPGDQLDSDEVNAAIAQRRAFAEKAMAVLGVSDVWFGDFPCGRCDIIPVIEIGKLVETHIAQFLPDTVITHHCQDANSDHRITFNAVNTATRPVPVVASAQYCVLKHQVQPNGDLSTPFNPACLLMYQTRSTLKLRHLIAILKRRDVNFLSRARQKG